MSEINFPNRYNEDYFGNILDVLHGYYNSDRKQLLFQNEKWILSDSSEAGNELILHLLQVQFSKQLQYCVEKYLHPNNNDEVRSVWGKLLSSLDHRLRNPKPFEQAKKNYVLSCIRNERYALYRDTGDPSRLKLDKDIKVLFENLEKSGKADSRKIDRNCKVYFSKTIEGDKKKSPDENELKDIIALLLEEVGLEDVSRFTEKTKTALQLMIIKILSEGYELHPSDFSHSLAFYFGVEFMRSTKSDADIENEQSYDFGTNGDTPDVLENDIPHGESDSVESGNYYSNYELELILSDFARRLQMKCGSMTDTQRGKFLTILYKTLIERKTYDQIAKDMGYAKASAIGHYLNQSKENKGIINRFLEENLASLFDGRDHAEQQINTIIIEIEKIVMVHYRYYFPDGTLKSREG